FRYAQGHHARTTANRGVKVSVEKQCLSLTGAAFPGHVLTIDGRPRHYNWILADSCPLRLWDGSTVNNKFTPSDRRRPVRNQERHQLCDFLGPVRTSEWNPAQ